MKEKISYLQAIAFIFLMTILVSGTALAASVYHKYQIKSRQKNPKYYVKKIVQKTEGPSLDSMYIAEILGLSIDMPTNIYQLHPEYAKAYLEKSPVILEAKVQKILPDTVEVNYRTPLPIAYLFDITNTAISPEGYLFPVEPFFSPKKLPKIYLGLNRDTVCEKYWGGYIDTLSSRCAIEILQYITESNFHAFFDTLFIDTSMIHLEDLFSRQIIMVMQTKKIREAVPFRCLWLVHLDAQEWKKGLNRCILLAQTPEIMDENKKKITIDMRYENKAFIE